jgi:hypothetical protein
MSAHAGQHNDVQRKDGVMAAEASGARPSDGTPVFLDVSGRRHRLVRVAGWLLGLLVLVYLTMLGVSISASPGFLPLSFPGVSLLPNALAPKIPAARPPRTPLGPRTRRSSARPSRTGNPTVRPSIGSPGRNGTGGHGAQPTPGAASPTTHPTPSPSTHPPGKPTTHPTPSPSTHPSGKPTTHPPHPTPTHSHRTGKPTTRPTPTHSHRTGRPTAKPTHSPHGRS